MKPNLLEFFKELMLSPEGLALMVKHGLLKEAVTDKLSMGQVIGGLKAVCEGAQIFVQDVCPVVNSLPSA